MKPLEGFTILDFSQFLSGPSAGLRFADLGATVIKVEKTGVGDICRTLYVSNLILDGESSIFHAINRNKDGICLDLKSDEGKKLLKPLLAKADAMIINFRPGVAKKLELDYDSISQFNPGIVYGEITGYGNTGPWASIPGQDLLVQSLSGLCWLNGNASQPPTPFGLSIADMFAGQHLVQGMLAALFHKQSKGKGAYVQVSLLESILDVQFELFTTFLNDGHKLPKRSLINNANAYINAPYGIYETMDGYLALAMVPIPDLAKLISCEALYAFNQTEDCFTKRDEIKKILAIHLKKEKTTHWLCLLEQADVWCADVFTWEKMLQSEGFQALDMLQTIQGLNATRLLTTRCPIRIDGEIYKSEKGAPKMGQDNKRYLCE